MTLHWPEWVTISGRSILWKYLSNFYNIFVGNFSVNCCPSLQKAEYFHLVSVYKISGNERRSSYVWTFATEFENNVDDFLWSSCQDLRGAFCRFTSVWAHFNNYEDTWFLGSGHCDLCMKLCRQMMHQGVNMFVFLKSHIVCFTIRFFWWNFWVFLKYSRANGSVFVLKPCVSVFCNFGV